MGLNELERAPLFEEFFVSKEKRPLHVGFQPVEKELGPVSPLNLGNLGDKLEQHAFSDD